MDGAPPRPPCAALGGSHARLLSVVAPLRTHSSSRLDSGHFTVRALLVLKTGLWEGRPGAAVVTMTFSARRTASHPAPLSPRHLSPVLKTLGEFSTSVWIQLSRTSGTYGSRAGTRPDLSAHIYRRDPDFEGSVIPAYTFLSQSQTPVVTGGKEVEKRAPPRGRGAEGEPAAGRTSEAEPQAPRDTGCVSL